MKSIGNENNTRSWRFVWFASLVLWAMAPCARAVDSAEAAAGSEGAVIENFEADLAKAPAVQGGWESNAGVGSTSSIAKVSTAKNGTGAGELNFNVKAGDWALVQKKVEGAEWLKRAPKAVSFWVKGEGTGEIVVELEESYSFKWRKSVPLTDKNWHQVTLKFSEFASDDKNEPMSAADLVLLKFVSFGGKQKVLVDDIKIEFNDQGGN